MKLKMLKNAKALSPVVASIILIAVTVAVSIAVAAWMASLAGNQMNTEGLTFLGEPVWATPSGTTIPWVVITVKNTGATDLSVAEARVDNNAATVTGTTLPYALTKGSQVSLNITSVTFTRGVQYNFYVVTSKGNTFGPYVKTAP